MTKHVCPWCQHQFGDEDTDRTIIRTGRKFGYKGANSTRAKICFYCWCAWLTNAEIWLGDPSTDRLSGSQVEALKEESALYKVWADLDGVR